MLVTSALAENSDIWHLTTHHIVLSFENICRADLKDKNRRRNCGTILRNLNQSFSLATTIMPACSTSVLSATNVPAVSVDHPLDRAKLIMLMSGFEVLSRIFISDGKKNFHENKLISLFTFLIIRNYRVFIVVGSFKV